MAIVVATLGAAGALSATAIRGRNAARRDDDSATHVSVRSVSQAETAVTGASQSPAESRRGAAAVPQGEPALPAARASSAVGASVTPSATLTAAPTPTIPIGESPLGNGVIAQRSDSVVVLLFDTPMTRTRLPDKFENFVRSTLPRVYGEVADSALAHIPDGALARQGSLLNDLPIRGMRVALSGGWAITLYPETRPGQDGPLVVRYRAMVTK